jgi:hypothetical protein
MKGTRYIIATAIAAGLVIAAAVPTKAAPELRRLAAQFDYFGAEAVTSLGVDPAAPEAGGSAVYRVTVTVPAGENVVYLTMSTTGDTHNGIASCFSALIDGRFFNPGTQGSAECGQAGEKVPGWVNLIKLPLDDNAADNCNDGGGGSADCHDNNIHYEWCTRVAPGVHTLQIRMAATPAGSDVFIEEAHFYVDTNSIGVAAKRCAKATTPTGTGGARVVKNQR